MSHWIEMPTVYERGTGAVVFEFGGREWSLDECVWLDAQRVRIVVRKYPGNRRPSDVVVVLDCASGTASLDDGRTLPFQRLEGELDAEMARRPQATSGRLPG